MVEVTTVVLTCLGAGLLLVAFEKSAASFKKQSRTEKYASEETLSDNV